MAYFRSLVLTAIGAAALGLVTPSLPGYAAPAPQSPPATPRQVQVTVEWVKTAPASTQSLALSTTDDTTGTVSLQPATATTEEATVTARPHINSDGTITVRLAISRVGTDKTMQSSTTTRTFKPGERLAIGNTGLTLNGVTSSNQVFVKVAIQKAADDPFAAPAGFPVMRFNSATAR